MTTRQSRAVSKALVVFFAALPWLASAQPVETEMFRADLTKPQDLADILNQFFRHTEPDFQRWDKASETPSRRCADWAAAHR